jgi:hypothetical protein
MPILPTYRIGCLLICFSLIACNRTTIVSGHITDLRNGQPLANLPVYLTAYKGYEHDSANRKFDGRSSTTTDNSGKYSLEFTDSGIDYIGISIGLDVGCYYDFFNELVGSGSLRAGCSNEYNIKTIPIDGHLRIRLKNTTGQADTVYCGIDSDGQGYAKALCAKRLTLPIAAGQTTSFNTGIAGDQYIKIYWGTTDFLKWDAPRVDSVYCPRNDTTLLDLGF